MSAPLSPAAVEWLMSGERGLSSRAIFDWLLLGQVDREWGAAYPRDPDDFRRCELLLRQVPELRDRMPEMAALGPEWAALVEHWSEIVAVFEREVALAFQPGARLKASAPQTYGLMVRIEREAQMTR